MWNYLCYGTYLVMVILLLVCAYADWKGHKESIPHDEPAEETPELDPEVMPTC